MVSQPPAVLQWGTWVGSGPEWEGFVRIPSCVRQSHRPWGSPHELDAGFQDCGWLQPHVATLATGLPRPSRESLGPLGAPRRGASSALRPPPPASGGSCAGSKFITFYNTISRADRCIRDRTARL